MFRRVERSEDGRRAPRAPALVLTAALLAIAASVTGCKPGDGASGAAPPSGTSAPDSAPPSRPPRQP